MNIALGRCFNSTNVRKNVTYLFRHTGIRIAAAVAPSWLARAVATRFITPPHYLHTPRELAQLAHGRRVAITTPMGSLAAWQFGDRWRPAVVVSHGWGGRGAQFQHFIAPLIAADFQVWLFDHVSHGMSEGHEAPITDFANGLTAVVRSIEAEGVNVVGMVGHSLGCAGIGIALRGGLRAMENLRVVQLAPPASLIRYSRFFARAIGLPERIRAAMQWRLEQRIGVNWQDFEMPAAVASQTPKTLVIHDQHDRDVRIDAGLAVARSWPDARFKRTEGLGHRRMLRAAEVIDATVDFLKDRVEFQLPPAADEWSAFPTPSPLY